MELKDHSSDKGILKAAASKSKFELNRYEPSAGLAPYIEHFWTVRYDLTGQPPFRQTILSFPSVNLSFEQEGGSFFTGVYGVPRTTYTRVIQNEGMVLGIKFRPGGFYPFWQQPVSLLTGRICEASDLFGPVIQTLQEQIWQQDSGEQMARLGERFLLERLPEPDDNAELTGRIIQLAINNREMTRVEEMAEQSGMSVRALQRLFSRYVGVSPKWVIQRYRMQEAAELLEQGGALDWASLSQQLGFYDQAHFIKTFKAMIGKSPDAYVRDIPPPA
ncbi:helix-turn-helix domain-containing protein [Paenibacillus kobensis]|uniref:helix-turn-helix domain-containing protein n=1 Tax=Paenibacillus kobensis TaxID=59841 RepID=UPI000FD6DAAA|nr:AraC family transcriptional regulator [Paenibacillus kobensis]